MLNISTKKSPFLKLSLCLSRNEPQKRRKVSIYKLEVLFYFPKFPQKDWQIGITIIFQQSFKENLNLIKKCSQFIIPPSLRPHNLPIFLNNFILNPSIPLNNSFPQRIKLIFNIWRLCCHKCDDGGEGMEMPLIVLLHTYNIQIITTIRMLSSKNIKNIITNNQQHSQISKQDLIKDEAPEHNKQVQNEQQYSYAEESDNEQIQNNQNSQQCQNESYEVEDESEEEQDLDEDDRRNGMFTIREQQSYQYQSQNQSFCHLNKPIQSQIEEFSTIKADKQKDSADRELNSKDEEIKFQEYSTINSKDHQTSKIQTVCLLPNVEEWKQEEQKQKKIQNIQQQVRDQAILQLKQFENFMELPKKRSIPMLKRPSICSSESSSKIAKCSLSIKNKISVVLNQKLPTIFSSQKQNIVNNQQPGLKRDQKKRKIKLLIVNQSQHLSTNMNKNLIR